MNQGTHTLAHSERVSETEYILTIQYSSFGHVFSIDVDILNAMLKNACAVKDNDYVICILRKMISKKIEPTDESMRMVDEYHSRAFGSLRSYHVVSKKMRNECFKLTRECKQWKKYFRNDRPKDESNTTHHDHDAKSNHSKKRPDSKAATAMDGDRHHIKHQNKQLSTAP